MGDWFQTVVATRTPQASSADVADGVRNWLASEGVICPFPTECVLGGSGFGYAPGPNYQAAVSAPDGGLVDLVSNGLDIQTGRNVAFDYQGEHQWKCGSCGQWQSDMDVLMEALSTWYDGNDSATVVCGACSACTPLATVETTPAIACGHLLLTFWNWPPLTDAFLQSVSEHVGGPVALVAGKL